MTLSVRLAEPLARLGADVTGIDAAERNIAIARRHTESVGTRLTYLPCTAEDLAAQGAQFDVVLAMEIVEHVADLDAFFKAAAGMLNVPGYLYTVVFIRNGF